MIANSPVAAQQPRRLVGQRVGDAFGGRLIDEEIAGVGLGVGVPGQRRGCRVRAPCAARWRCRPVLDGDRNGVHLSRDPVLDELVLFRGVEAGRSVPHQIDVELARRFFRTGAAADEVGIALRLRHDGDDGPARCGGMATDVRRRSQRRRPPRE